MWVEGVKGYRGHLEIKATDANQLGSYAVGSISYLIVEKAGADGSVLRAAQSTCFSAGEGFAGGVGVKGKGCGLIQIPPAAYDPTTFYAASGVSGGMAAFRAADLGYVRFDAGDSDVTTPLAYAAVDVQCSHTGTVE
jgi:hypothetical protein